MATAPRYERLLARVAETPWALRPSVLAAILEFLSLRAAGEKFTDEEIQERIGDDPPHRDPERAASVAVLPLYGVIAPRADVFTQISGGTSLQSWREVFREAMASEDVGSVVLDIDSPGGSVNLVEETADEIRAGRGKKPIVAMANTQAASAAYWIGTAADQFVVTPSGEVGSIGVWAAHDDISKAMEKEGIKTTLISAGKFKTEGNPFEPLTDEAREAIQETVNEYYESFLKAVAVGRGVEIDDVRNGFGEGRMVTAAEAVRMGMVDREATLEQVVGELGGAEARSRLKPRTPRMAFPAPGEVRLIGMAKPPKRHRIDPEKTTVEVDGRSVSLVDLAAARDYVRAEHIAPDPYPMVDVEVRESGAARGAYTISGHAAVFNRWSLDLGGFRERVAETFFDDILASDPDVHAMWQHQPHLVLARTRNNTLELRKDAEGLYNWMRVAPTSFAEDLRVLMERGDIDQESFSFVVGPGGDEWEMDEEGNIWRTLLKGEALYDVTITAQGAYPQAASAVNRSIRDALARPRTLVAVTKLPVLSGTDSVVAPKAGTEDRIAAPEADGEGDSTSHEGEEKPTEDVARKREALERLKAKSRSFVAADLGEYERRLNDLE